MITGRRTFLSLLLCTALALPLWAGPSGAGLGAPTLAKGLTQEGRLYILDQQFPPTPNRLLPIDSLTLA